MFNRLLICAMGIVLHFVVSTANGELIFSEEFEGPGYVVGDKPPSAIWEVTESPGTARIANFGNPGQSVHFVDNSSGDVRMRHRFAPQTSFVFEYDILVDGTEEGAHAQVQGPVADWQLIFLTSGQVALSNPGGSFVDTNFFAYEVGEWYRVTRTVDVIAGTGTISVVQVDDLTNGRSKLDANPHLANTFFDTIILGTSGSLGSDSYIDNISITSNTSPIVVDIDIKPGSDPNSINLRSNGVLPVAILTTDEFDVLDIDDDTLRFGDPELVNVPDDGVTPVKIRLEDVDDDGDLDLLLFFSVLEIDVFGVLDEESVGALVTGATLDDVAIEGADFVRIVPPKVP